MTAASKTVDEFGPDAQGARGWRPAAPGDAVLGTIVEVDAGWSDWMNDRQGGSYPIITVREDDEKLVNVHCFQTVLYRRVMSLRPQLGERIELTFHGKKERADKTTVAQFTVRVAGRTQTDVYDRLAVSTPHALGALSRVVSESQAPPPARGASGDSSDTPFQGGDPNERNHGYRA